MAAMASAFVGTRVQVGRRATVRARPRFVVRASVETDRRKVLRTALAAIAVLPAAAFSKADIGGQTREQQRQQQRRQQERGMGMGQERSEIETQARGGRAQVPPSQTRQQQSRGGQEQRMGQERGQIDIGGSRRQGQQPMGDTSEQVQEQQRGGIFGGQQEQQRQPVEVQARAQPTTGGASVRDMRDRVKNSQRRLESEVRQNLQRGDWDASRDNLRNQMASLRPDLNDLANAASDSRRAQEKNKAFQDSIDKLEVAIRNQNKDEALKQYDSAIENLDIIIVVVG